MPKFALLTRLQPEAYPIRLKQRETAVKESIRHYCPDVSWVSNYVANGPFDYLDVFAAPDIETAMRVAALTRHHGAAHAEIWPVVEWEEYKRVTSDLDTTSSLESSGAIR